MKKKTLDLHVCVAPFTKRFELRSGLKKEKSLNYATPRSAHSRIKIIPTCGV